MKRYLCLLIIFFIVNKANSQVITPQGPAAFCDGGSVVLQAPLGSNYKWFIGGVLIAATSRNYTATVSGSYTVTVTIAGSPVTTAAVVVTVNPKPVPAISADTNNVCSGTPVQFTSNITNGTPPFTYSWTFGDGGTSTAQNPSHAFISLGCGTVSLAAALTVTDAKGCTGTVSKLTSIKQAPDVQLSDSNFFSPFSNCDKHPTTANPLYNITVNNTSTGAGCIKNYTVTWGDGVIQNNLTADSFPLHHTYTQIGGFNLVVTALGNNGCTNTKIYLVANQNEPVVSLGNASDVSGCVPLDVKFVIGGWANNSAGTIYVLNFGDNDSLVLTHPLNSTGSSEIISHQYNVNTSCPISSGLPVKLTATNGCKTNAFNGTVEVYNSPKAKFSVPVNPSCVNKSLCFINETVSGYYTNCNANTAYSWNFGDPGSGSSNTSTSKNPCHTYSSPGTYTVTLSASNPCGFTTFSMEVCVIPAPAPLFNLDTTAGCSPLTISATNISDTSTCKASTFQWSVTYNSRNCGTTSSWQYTPGSSSSSTNPSFIFNNPGTYTISLKIISDCGGNLSFSRSVDVKKSPTLSLPLDTTACGPVNYNTRVIIPSCEISSISYSWTFEGGSLSTSDISNPGPVYFSTPGNHSITLIATNSCGITTDTQHVIINPVPIVAAPPDTTICAGLSTAAFRFTSSAVGATFSWTNSNTSIGLRANGAGNIAPFTTVNTKSVPDTAIIIVIATVANCGTSKPDTFLIIVQPAITVTDSVAVCKNNLPYLWHGQTYNNTGTYQFTINNTTGCDTIATLQLSVIPIARDTSFVNICPAQLPYTWQGSSFNVAGYYTDTLKGVLLCDSLSTLALTVSDTIKYDDYVSVCTKVLPFTWNTRIYTTSTEDSVHLKNTIGCDSIAFLHLTVNDSTKSTTNISVCKNKLPFTWNGNSYNTSDTFIVRLTNAFGCDSVAMLVLTINDTTSSNTHDSICPSQLPYYWNGLTLNGTSTDSVLFTNSMGCDSTARIFLYVKDTSSSATDISLCSNQFPFTWNSNTYNVPGNYRVTLVNAEGCDSVASLNLYKKDTSFSATDTSICRNDLPFIWNGSQYNTSGLYNITLVNAAGCDSIAGLRLTVKDTSATNTTIRICPSQLPYSWNGILCSTGGSYKVIFINAAGCDSVINLNLIIKDTSSSLTVKSVCPSDIPYYWNGNIYSAAGTYQVILINAAECDSVATLQLIIKDTSSSTTNVSVCREKLPYLWNGSSYSAAGTYLKTLVNAVGCDSAATLNLSIKRGTISITAIKICPSQLPFSWNGKIYNSSVIDSVTLTGLNDCDSIAKLILTVKTITKSDTDSGICQNSFPFYWNGNTYNTPGTYTVILTNSQGCDSVAKLVLSLKPSSTSTVNIAVCNDKFPYLWHGNYYYTAGTYYDTLVNAVNCDSIIKLVINVASATSSLTQLTICTNQLPFVWNTVVCNTAGIYHDTLINSFGCDSVLTLYLTTKAATISNTTVTVCPLQLPYTWNGVTYNASGTDTVILVNAARCDSLAILHLVVAPSIRDTMYVSTCTNLVPYFFNGKFYFVSGYYSDTFHTNAGCDSIITLKLTVNSTSSSNTYDTICKKDLPFSWNGNVYSTPGSYTITLSNSLGCDSVATLHLKVLNSDTTVVYSNVCQSKLPYIWNGNSYNAAGTYLITFTPSNGCDSVAKLILSVTQNPASPNAVSNSPVCEGATLTLQSASFSGGNYLWSGPNGFLSTAQNSTITNVKPSAAGNYYLTVTVNGCTTADTTTISIIPKSIGGNTNNDSSVCSGTNTGTIYLTGNTGTVIRWESSVNNGALWTPVNNTTALLTYNNLTANTWYRAVVQTGTCPEVFSDTTKISIIPNADIAKAGSDQKLCNQSFANLLANNPLTGTGRWTQVFGPAQANFNNPNIYNTTVIGLQAGATYRFVWTITSPANCNNSSDTVEIINRPKITAANAGADITICDFPNTSSVNLKGNKDNSRLFETGLWSVLAQPAFSTASIGSPSSPSSSFTFNQAGTYSLAYTISNDIATGCPASMDTIVINVSKQPVSAFTPSPLQFCLGQPVTVANTSSNANQYKWFWGDGDSSSFISGQHLYTSAGSFTIMLISKKADALAVCTDTSMQKVTVVNKIKAQMNVAAGAACVPYNLKVSAANTTGASLIQWKIFDHSVPPGIFSTTGSTASHIYNFAGGDSVRLIVYSSNGCSDSITYKFTVNNVPASTFTPMLVNTCSHDTTINFTAASIYSGSDPLHYTWFIDSTIKGNTNPFNYRFLTAGTNLTPVVYTIRVRAENAEGCGDTSLAGKIIIQPQPPISIKVSPSLIQQQPDYTFTFEDTASFDSLALYQWNMGDKSLQTRDGKTITYKYSDTGVYKVALLKTNFTTGCFSSDSVSVTILPVPGYLQVPNAICPGCHENALRTFLPLGKGLKEYHLRIYNKWGQKIFETSDLNADGSPKTAWDGRWVNKDGSPGELLQQNAYTWQIEARYINGTEWKGMVYPNSKNPVKAGFITIIK